MTYCTPILILLVPTQLVTPTASSFVHAVSKEEEYHSTAKVLFDFTATSEFELSVSGEPFVAQFHNSEFK